MSKAIITSVDATVSPDLEAPLIEGYQRVIATDIPDGLLRAELLRGQDGAWRLQSTWRDMDALMAARESGNPPAALRLLQDLGIESTHGWFVMEAGF